MSFDEIFSTVFTYTTWFVFMFVYSLEKKKSEILIIKVVFTISLFKKSPFPQYCLSRVMAVHNILIKVEIKQTKMNLFYLHFNPVFSRNSLTTHVLHKLSWRN